MSIRVKTYYFLTRIAEIPIIGINIVLSVQLIILVLRLNFSGTIFYALSLITKVITSPFAGIVKKFIGEGIYQESIILIAGCMYTVLYVCIHELLKQYFIISQSEEEDE